MKPIILFWYYEFLVNGNQRIKYNPKYSILQRSRHRFHDWELLNGLTPCTMQRIPLPPVFPSNDNQNTVGCSRNIPAEKEVYPRPGCKVTSTYEFCVQIANGEYNIIGSLLLVQNDARLFGVHVTSASAQLRD